MGYKNKAIMEIIISGVQLALIILFYFVSLFMSHYITAWAKRKAVERKDKEIINIKHDLQKEIEKYKDDLAKRKHQYEKKSETYLAFFNLLDSSGFESKEYMQKTMEINNKFYTAFLDATKNNDKVNEEKALSTFQKDLSDLMVSSRSGMITAISASNAIQLVGGQEVRDKLSEYFSYNEEIMKISDDSIKLLPALIYSNDKQKTQQMDQNLKELGKECKLKLESLKDAMRRDLEIE